MAAATAWQGRRIDATGYYYFGARYYDPETRRFLSPDPLGYGSNLSLYDFCDGDPVNQLDPDGRCPEEKHKKKKLSAAEKIYKFFDKKLPAALEKVNKAEKRYERATQAVGHGLADLNDQFNSNGDKHFEGGPGEFAKQLSLGILDVPGSLLMRPVESGGSLYSQVRNGEFSAYSIDPTRNPRLLGNMLGSGGLEGVLPKLFPEGGPVVRSGTDFWAAARRKTENFRALMESEPGYVEATRNMWDAIEDQFIARPQTHKDIGNLWHYDKLNGGTGEGLPTALTKMYPRTVFEFNPRGPAGADVKVVGGIHPSEYPGSTWKSGNVFGDYKPNTDSAVTTFLGEIRTGKLPANTQYIPYSQETGEIGL